MQPNEQEPTQPPATPPVQPGAYPPATPASPPAPTPAAPPQTPPGTIAPSFTTPDFFQLDPITDPFIVKKNKLRLIIVLVSILLTISAVVVTIMYLQNTRSDQDDFYDAIVNNLNTRSISRTYELITDNKIAKVAANTDFEGGWTGVKSNLKYNINGSDCDQVFATGVFYLKCSTISEPLSRAGIGIGQWYKHSMSDQSGVSIYDELDLGGLITSPYDILPIGMLDDAQKDNILEYIKKNEIYTIKKITKLDNGEAYDVSTTADKLNKLWGEIAKVTGVGRPYLPLTYMASIEDFMVTTNSSSRIESISFKDSGKKRDIKIQYKISDVSIGVPSAAKELTLVATNKEDLND
jgi:hypothetical protein